MGRNLQMMIRLIFGVCLMSNPVMAQDDDQKDKCQLVGQWEGILLDKIRQSVTFVPTENNRGRMRIIVYVGDHEAQRVYLTYSRNNSILETYDCGASPCQPGMENFNSLMTAMSTPFDAVFPQFMRLDNIRMERVSNPANDHDDLIDQTTDALFLSCARPEKQL
jgi:hypothetical protein